MPDFKSFFANAKHVINISYKPTAAHFTKTMKIVLIGTLIVGILGFVVSSIVNLVLTGRI
ncbi:MAG: protein translocase SEC61 complex subunit gamma [Candidatus Micrarchaeota archaeon]|nr:protein translocase SEC61 complex subunit gamma [Candidatus Micrarchaeota archaeon]